MMATRYLHIVRHGQIDRSAAVRSRLGPGLTEVGREQARLTAEALAALPLRVIHTSTPRRVVETADIIMAVSERFFTMLGVKPVAIRPVSCGRSCDADGARGAVDRLPKRDATSQETVWLCDTIQTSSESRALPQAS